MSLFVAGILGFAGASIFWLGLNWHEPVYESASWRDGGRRPLPEFVRLPDSLVAGDTLFILPVQELDLVHRAQFRRIYEKELAELPSGPDGERLQFSRLLCDGFRPQVANVTLICLDTLSSTESDFRDTALPLRFANIPLDSVRLQASVPRVDFLRRMGIRSGRVVLVSRSRLWIQVVSRDHERLHLTASYTILNPHDATLTAYGMIDAFRGYAMKPARGSPGNLADTTITKQYFGAFGRRWIDGHLFEHVAAQIAAETPFSDSVRNARILGTSLMKRDVNRLPHRPETNQ